MVVWYLYDNDYTNEMVPLNALKVSIFHVWKKAHEVVFFSLSNLTWGKLLEATPFKYNEFQFRYSLCEISLHVINNYQYKCHYNDIYVAYVLEGSTKNVNNSDNEKKPTFLEIFYLEV